MERRASRASILKRKSLNQTSLNESISDTTTTIKDPKRVSFHSSNFVKPFATDPEKFTIWDNTYEEAANNTDSTKSNENTDTRMSQFSGTSFNVPQYENLQDSKLFCGILRSSDKAKVKVTTEIEHEKENNPPIACMSLNTSNMDMSLCTIGLGTSISCLDGPEPINYDSTIVDFTCTYQNRPIQENTAEHKNLELKMYDEELRYNFPNISTLIKSNLETTTTSAMEFTCAPSDDDQNINSTMDITCGPSNNQNITSTMDITCSQSNKQDFTSTMDITCGPSNNQNITSTMDITCSQSNKQDVTPTMDFTCVPSNKQNITPTMDITCSLSNKRDIASTMDFTCVPSNKQNITSTMDMTCSLSNKRDINSTMEFTCLPSNKQNITSALDFTCALNTNENITSAMNFTCASNKQNIASALDFTCSPKNKENITSAIDFTSSAASNKQCNNSELVNLDKNKTNMGIIKDSTLEIDYGHKTNKELKKAASDLKNNSAQNDDSLSDKPVQDEVGLKLTNSSRSVNILNKDSSSINQSKLFVESTITNNIEIQRDFKIFNDSDERSNLTDYKDDAHSQNVSGLCLISDNEVLLTPKTINPLQMANTPGTSFDILGNSFGTTHLEKPIYTSNARKGWCLDSQKPAEWSSTNNLHKEGARENFTYDYCNDNSLADILKSNANCTLFDTTPLLDMSLNSPDKHEQLNLEFDKSTETNSMKNCKENGTDQKSLGNSQLEYRTVPNTTDLLLESTHSVFNDDLYDKIRERLNAPQILFDNTPVSEHLLKKMEKIHEEVLHLLENFKVPEILTIDLEELAKLENEYGESSTSILSDGVLCSSSGENNSADDADFEVPKSLEERLQEQAKRSIKYWQFVKRVNNDCYCFYTFYKAVPFKVYADPNSGVVREIETFINLVDDFLPSYFYEARYMQEKLKKDNLQLALGSTFDMLTLLDYVVMRMEELKAFDKEYDELENDFGQQHRLTMNPDFSMTIEILSGTYVLWWIITVDLSITHLGRITSAKAHHNESTDEPVNEEDIKKIAENTEGPLFIRNFINNLNHYVKIEGRKRLDQRKENLKNKYNFL